MNAIFKFLFNSSVFKYHHNEKLNTIKQIIESTDIPISTLAYDFGFTDVNHLSKQFKIIFGISPSVLRDKKTPLY